MSFTGALAQSLSNSFSISGRAGRHEFWCFFIFYMWVWFLMLALLVAQPFTAPVFFLIGCSAVLPMFSVTVRRLHDINFSGYWMLLSLVPVIGSYALSLMLTCPGTKGENRYGPEPVPAPPLAVAAA